MAGYGQFCPVAKAMELLDERWTMLVVRELTLGSRYFNELRRGVPKMSPTLLSKRLHTLTRAGIIERWQDGNRVGYQLTPAGWELEPIVQALGRWGVRWLPELGDDDLDPHLLLWDIHRNIDVEAIPGGRAVLKFCFTDVPRAGREWWVVVNPDEVDVCDADPGFDVRVTVESTLRAMVQVWRGDITWREAMRSGDLTLVGDVSARNGLPRWLRLSPLAPVPRPDADPLPAPSRAQ